MIEGDYTSAKAWYTECLLFDREIGVFNQLPECLIGFASIANSEKYYERVAQLIGAADAQLGGRQSPPLEDFDQAELQRLKMSLSEQLGESSFEALEELEELK